MEYMSNEGTKVGKLDWSLDDALGRDNVIH